MTNVLLEIQYDGTHFSGWQRQLNARTVQGEIEKVLSTLCLQKIDVQGTSRTDAGVHAYMQGVSFKGDFAIPVNRIKKAANGLLPDDIYIRKAIEVDEDFHARFSSVGKTYQYKILNTQEKDIFSRNYYYNICKPLDLEMMKEAGACFVGTHNFITFMSSKSQVENTIRTIYSLNIQEEIIKHPQQGRLLIIEVTGKSFLYNMVRIIAGTLIDVGLRKIKANEINDIILSKDRWRARHTAPAKGLYLKKIYFDETELKEKIK